MFKKSYKKTVGADYGYRTLKIYDADVYLNLWDSAGKTDS